MAGSVMLSSSSVPVAPGGAGTCSVRIRNTGTVVDQFTVSVLGDPASWTTITPASISLFPGAEGTVELHFAPPRGPLPAAGPLPFGVRVVPTEDPDGSVVEEGNIDLQPFTEITAKITPRTSEAKRSARHEILVDNRGNTTVEADIEASDPDEQLAFELKPRVLTVAPGDTARATVKVAARKGFARGSDKHRPFTVNVTPGPGQPANRLDGTLIQHAGLPRFLLPAGVAVIALALIAFVAIPALGGKTGSGSGLFNLTSDNEATTIPPLDEEAAAAAQAEADAKEAQAAAEAELAANGQDGTGAAGTGAGATAAGAAGGGTATATGGSSSGGSGGGEETVTGATVKPGTAPTTAPPAGGGGGGSPATTAAPAGSPATTTSPATTSPPTPPATAAPSAPSAKNFLGDWVSAIGAMNISIPFRTSNMSVSVSGKTAFTCSGTVTDAGDDAFTASCSDGPTRTFTYLSGTDQVRMTTPTTGTFCPRTGCVSTTTWDRA